MCYFFRWALVHFLNLLNLTDLSFLCFYIMLYRLVLIEHGRQRQRTGAQALLSDVWVKFRRRKPRPLWSVGSRKEFLFNILADGASTGTHQDFVGCSFEQLLRWIPHKHPGAQAHCVCRSGWSLAGHVDAKRAIMFSARFASIHYGLAAGKTRYWMLELGLTSCADTIVGGELIKEPVGRKTNVCWSRQQRYVLNASDICVGSYWYLMHP
jgi:hypothetical protein